MKTFDQAARKQAMGIANLVIRKQHAYGPRNILNCPAGVETGIVVRLSDKLARLANLTAKGKNPEWETLSDTADDIMGYGLVLKLYLEGEFELPLEEEKDAAPNTNNILHERYDEEKSQDPKGN